MVDLPPDAGSPLPIVRTALLGRDDEVARLVAALEQPSNGVITIVGPGGCGKTRLAIEVARRSAAGFDHQVTYVPLADLDDPTLVTTEVARALGFVGAPGDSPSERVVAGLGHRRVLVVLDNFEHLSEASAEIEEVAARCSGVALLITSRRQLRVTGETVVELAPLALPPVATTDNATHEGLGPSPAVQLFLERAAEVNPAISPADPALATISEICGRLDGLPLAIEIVASWVRLLTLEEILDRLDATDGGLDRLDHPPPWDRHHRNLHDAIAWSYELLSEAAARLLPRLAVFREGWSLEAMSSVCAGGDDDGVHDALAELVDLHLVEPVDDGDGEARFRLLRTVRRFGWEALVEAATDREISARHAAFFAHFARTAGVGFATRHGPIWSRRIGRELPNIRGALEHLAASENHVDGLTAACALGPYWLDEGSAGEGLRWIDRFLAGVPVDEPLGAAADGWSVRFAVMEGHTASMATEHEPYRRLLRDRSVLEADGDLPAALAVVEHLSYLLRIRGEYEQVDDLLATAIERCTTIDTAWIRCELIHRRALVARDRNQHECALVLLDQTIEAARLARNDRVLARALGARAAYRALSDDAAMKELDAGYDLSLELGDRRGAAGFGAVLALGAGDAGGGGRRSSACLELGIRSGYRHAVVWGLAGVAGAAALAGRSHDGARLLGLVRDDMPTILRLVPPHAAAAYGMARDRLQAALGNDFEAECEAGRAGGLEAAVARARRLHAQLWAADAPHHRRERRTRGPRSNPELTARELEVVAELVAGGTNEEIARRLRVSTKTVMHHTVSVYRKLGVRGRAEAVTWALRTGLVTT